MVVREEVLKHLERVTDPELGVDVVALGLIYEVRIDGTAVLVQMTMTTPFCPFEGYFRKAVQQAVEELPGITAVNVHFVFEPPWSPAMMKPGVRQQLGRTPARESRSPSGSEAR